MLKQLKIPKTENKRALVSIAHADDLLLFCGGTVVALTQAGWEVAVIRTTDDRWDSYGLSEKETIKRNQEEFIEAMDVIGIKKIYELKLPTDTLGSYSEVALRKSFISKIREFKPYLTITFDPDSYLYEDNQDHRLVGIAMAEANWASGFDKHPDSDKNKNQPWLPMANWYFGRIVAQETHYFDISKSFKEIVNATAIHRTMLINMARQLEIKGMATNQTLNITSLVEKSPITFAQKILTKSRKNQVKGVQYAEKFRVVDSCQIIDELRGI